MKIIGHRGAAGLALENTLPSFELAKLIGVDSIELDVHKTKDNHLVVIHDADLRRVAPNLKNTQVRRLSLKELKKITLRDNQSTIPTLEEVLTSTQDTPLYIELKAEGCTDDLIKILNKYKINKVTIASFKLNELSILRKLRPDLRLFGLERTKPIDIIHYARTLKLDGIGLNFWLLNPLTYLLARRANLGMYVYTVNNRFIGKLIHLIYPKVEVCTDHPEYFVKHPYPIVESIEKAKSGLDA